RRVGSWEGWSNHFLQFLHDQLDVASRVDWQRGPPMRAQALAVLLVVPGANDVQIILHTIFLSCVPLLAVGLIHRPRFDSGNLGPLIVRLSEVGPKNNRLSRLIESLCRWRCKALDERLDLGWISFRNVIALGHPRLPRTQSRPSANIGQIKTGLISLLSRRTAAGKLKDCRTSHARSAQSREPVDAILSLPSYVIHDQVEPVDVSKIQGLLRASRVAHNSNPMRPLLRFSGESRITLTPRISATSSASAIMSDALLLVSISILLPVCNTAVNICSSSSAPRIVLICR